MLSALIFIISYKGGTYIEPHFLMGPVAICSLCTSHIIYEIWLRIIQSFSLLPYPSCLSATINFRLMFG